MIAVLRSLLAIALLLPSFSAFADVTLRPNEKPKETTKDFTKDQKKNGFPAPEPVDGSAHFVAGQSVQVELQVSTAYLGLVRFVIREQPKYGTLSDIRPSPTGESNRAVVTYTHKGDFNELADQFTFAARIGEGTTTSAPGTIILSGRRPMAKLDVISQPRFKSMQPGEEDSATFMVMNTGNAAFSGDIVWPAPFTGPKHLDLAMNEKLSVLVAVKPMAPGAFHLDVDLQPGLLGSKVRSVVECAQSFLVTPGALALTFDPISGTRKGTIKVANGSASQLTLKVESGARLQVVKTLSLESKTTMDLEISLPKGDVAAFRGEVLVSQEPSRQKVLVSAEPKPAEIRLVGPADGKLDFGAITKGKKAELKVTIINDGGVPAVLQASQAPPFFIVTDLPKVKAEPGKQEEITLSFAPELPGTFNQSIVIGGNAGHIDLMLRGSMTDPSRPSTGVAAGATGMAQAIRPRDVDTKGLPAPVRPTVAPIPSARVPAPEPVEPAPVRVPAPTASPSPERPKTVQAAPTAAVAPAATPEPSAPASAKPEFRMSKLSSGALDAYGQLLTYGVSPTQLPAFQSQTIDPVPQLGALERGADYVVLMWKDPKVAPSKYMIETSYRVKNDATGLWLKTWKPVEPWSPAKSPATGITAGKIAGLQSDSMYEFRVVGIDPEGKFSKASDIIQITTSSPFQMPNWVWLSLAIVVLLGVLYKTHQVRQGEWQT